MSSYLKYKEFDGAAFNSPLINRKKSFVQTVTDYDTVERNADIGLLNISNYITNSVN